MGPTVDESPHQSEEPDTHLVVEREDDGSHLNKGGKGCPES